MTEYQKYILSKILVWLQTLDKEEDISDNEYMRLTDGGLIDYFKDTNGSRAQLNHSIWELLNEMNIKTERGKEWNPKRWKDFRSALDYQDVWDWLEEYGDDDTDLGMKSFSTFLALLSSNTKTKNIDLNKRKKVMSLMKTHKVKPSKWVFDMMDAGDDEDLTTS